MTGCYENKTILFIDILGFEQLVEDKQSLGPQHILEDVLKHLSEGYHKDHLLKEFIATICPASKKQHPDLSYHSFQISDSFIATAEATPVGVINLINIARYIQLNTLNKGILVRGSIGCGSVYHKGNQIFGPAYQKILKAEKNATFKEFNGAPVIQISEELLTVVETEDCCKKMFRSMVVSDDQKKIVVNPFIYIDSILSSTVDLLKSSKILTEKLSQYEIWAENGMAVATSNHTLGETDKNKIKDKFLFMKNWVIEQRTKVEKTTDLHKQLQQPLFSKK